MYRNLNKITCLSTVAVMFTSCSSNQARISGEFAGLKDKVLYLEQLTPIEEVIDSVTLNGEGGFSFKYQFDKKEPRFLNLKVDGKFVTLLVEPGESVDLCAFCDIAKTVQVRGSEGSELVAELNNSMSETFKSIDSMSTLLSRATDAEVRNKLSIEITEKYYSQKRKNISFIIENSNSMASIFALYQDMPNGMSMFNDDNDFLYYKLVSDSLQNKYPTSVHVRTLVKHIEQFENRKNIESLVISGMTEELNSPDLQVNDMFGKKQTLSSLKGKVVLLYFWSTQSPNASLINSELKNIYNTYKSRGFEIYQVSLDRSKQDWVNAITSQKLDWINVNDFLGENSPVVSAYNVGTIPSNYILGRDGSIVGKNLWENDLIKKIEDSI